MWSGCWERKFVIAQRVPGLSQSYSIETSGYAFILLEDRSPFLSVRSESSMFAFNKSAELLVSNVTDLGMSSIIVFVFINFGEFSFKTDLGISMMLGFTNSLVVDSKGNIVWLLSLPFEEANASILIRDISFSAYISLSWR